MRSSLRRNAWSAGCLALALFFVFDVKAEAGRRRRYHRSHAVVVALQPFLLVRSAAHAVAEPIVYDAPQVVMAPIRVAYRSLPQVFEGEEVDESELDVDEEDASPAPAAYYTSRARRRPSPPREQWAEPMDEGEDEGPRQAGAEEDFDGNDALRPSIGNNHAVLRNGVAQAPANAPESVKRAIWAANSLRHKPYIWGGGHGSFYDRGYDCSGTVSFALHGAGALEAPLPSSDFMRYGERGRGRWITIYARPGHTFAVIAGLRLDTTDFMNGGNTGPRWHADARDTDGYVARHPVGL